MQSIPRPSRTCICMPRANCGDLLHDMQTTSPLSMTNCKRKSMRSVPVAILERRHKLNCQQPSLSLCNVQKTLTRVYAASAWLVLLTLLPKLGKVHNCRKTYRVSKTSRDSWLLTKLSSISDHETRI